METKSKYLNPYIAGVQLGLVLLGAIYISGRGLGASGAFKDVVTATLSKVAPDHVAETPYWASRVSQSEHPLKSWLALEVLGVLIGGFISGAISGRLKITVDKGPRITSATRIVFAILGGILFGLGAQLGRGCTSGAALSGMAVLSSAGFITMMAIFGTGYLVAYFFRKLWI